MVTFRLIEVGRHRGVRIRVPCRLTRRDLVVWQYFKMGEVVCVSNLGEEYVSSSELGILSRTVVLHYPEAIVRKDEMFALNTAETSPNSGSQQESEMA